MFATRPLRAGVAVLLAASILLTLPSTARATSVVATSPVGGTPLNQPVVGMAATP